MCTFMHVLSITGLAKGFLGYWNGGRALFNFQVRQTAGVGEHVALSGAVSGQDGKFSVYRLVGKREITFSEERIIHCFRNLTAASLELEICLACNQYFVKTTNFKQE